MADPFLGIFDGGNNGLEDLGLGSSLAQHGSQVAQLQERLQHPSSFVGFQSQTHSSSTQPKLQHFDERTSGTQFLPPSQKLQHFDDPLLSSSPQSFHSMQSPSQQQFSDYHSPSQINMCWPRGQSSRTSSNYSGFVQGPEQSSPFRQPFNYGFTRSSSPRLQHFSNQTSMNSSPDRFATGPSQSPIIQHPTPSPTVSYSGSSPKGASPKTIDQQQQQQKSKQMGMQQSLYRQYQGTEGNHQQVEVGGQSRLQHLASSTIDVDQTNHSISDPGERNFSYSPLQSGSRDSVVIHQNSANKMVLDQYNSQQFQTPRFSAFNGGISGGGADQEEMYSRGNQHNMTTPQQPRYPFTDFQISNPQDLIQVKTSVILLQMQRIQQQIQQLREMGQPAQTQQLQYQFQRLYQIYVMQQQQRMQPNFQPQNYDQLRFLQQQRQQEKANRIAVEAMAKAALHNTESIEVMSGFPSVTAGQRMMGNPLTVKTGMDLLRCPQPPDTIRLGPSIVQKPAPVWNSQASRLSMAMRFQLCTVFQ